MHVSELFTWGSGGRLAREHMRLLGFADAALARAGQDVPADVAALGAVAQVRVRRRPSGLADVQRLSEVPDGRLRLFYSRSEYTATALDWAERSGVALFRFYPASTVLAANSHALALEAAPDEPEEVDFLDALEERSFEPDAVPPLSAAEFLAGVDALRADLRRVPAVCESASAAVTHRVAELDRVWAADGHAGASAALADALRALDGLARAAGRADRALHDLAAAAEDVELDPDAEVADVDRLDLVRAELALDTAESAVLRALQTAGIRLDRAA